MKIETTRSGSKHVEFTLTRDNGKSYTSFHIQGNNMAALEAGFIAIEENEANENKE